MNDYNYILKILVLGDSCVGKSCILSQYVDEEFPMIYSSTIGVDFKVKTIKTEDKNLKLMLWDTAGQERFRSITKSFYKGVHGVLIIYSVDDLDSFSNITFWLNEVEKNCYSTKPKIMIVGNKSDLDFLRKIQYNDGATLAKNFGLTFIEVSAKKNININEMFSALCNLILNDHILFENISGNKKKVPLINGPTVPVDSCMEQYKCW